MIGNRLRTAALLGLLSGLLVLAGYYLVGDERGLVIGLAIAAFTSFSSWFYSDRAALAAFQAQPVSQQEVPGLYEMVQRLSDRAGIPTPQIYIIRNESPNAFATGRDPNHAAVAVTEGILKLLTPEELEGVLAHELTHVRNHDTLTQAVAGTLAGSLTFLGRILTFGALYFPVSNNNRRGGNPLAVLFLVILAPISATIIQLAISRTREYAADAGAAEITHNPLALVSALEKLERVGHEIPMNGNPAMSPLLFINPLSKEGLAVLFRTHPSTESRIERLKQFAANLQTPALAS